MTEHIVTGNFLDQYLPSIYTCIKCRMCMTGDAEFRIVCPMKERFMYSGYSASGMVAIARSLQDGELDWGAEGAEVADMVYTCTMCKGCSEACNNIYYLTNEYFDVPFLVEMMRRELVSRGFAPPLVRDYFKSIQTYGNPFKLPEKDRGEWAKDLGIKTYSDQEYLFYVGDIGSYDERGQKCARAVAGCLLKSGISFGILASEEMSDGNEVKSMGESEEHGLFQFLAEENIRRFKDHGVRKIVTLSPHGFNAIKNEYPQFGGDFEVVHYTQLLAELIEQNKIIPSERRVRVTYHDPCYLGRHNQEYQAPRTVLSSIPGVELIEMALVKEEAFCCGGGGGNFFTDMLGGSKDSPNRIRVRQAYETGAEIIAVACPMCAKMLEDAIKAEELTEKMKVEDIGEILLNAMIPNVSWIKKASVISGCYAHVCAILDQDFQSYLGVA